MPGVTKTKGASRSRGPSKGPERALRGIGVSPGIAIGRVFLLEGGDLEVEPRFIEPARARGEVERFREAIDQASSDLAALREAATHTLGEEMARILDAHIMMLGDKSVIDQTITKIERERMSAESAYNAVVSAAADSLLEKDDEYIRDRATDLRDVCRRVSRILLGLPGARASNLRSNSIVVASEITASDVIGLPHNKVAAFVCDTGGKTSHTAILARSLGIPAVAGLPGASSLFREHDLVIVDGIHGSVIAHPGEATLRKYKKEEREYDRIEKALTALSELPAVTRDHHAFELTANIDLPGEVAIARSKGARGIGLYRTEFLYLLKGSAPTEEEQLQVYRDAAERVAPDDVIFRTLDLGADKLLPGAGAGERREANPFLGLRGIRYSLAERDLFVTQLRAILRASVRRNVKVMFPMIQSLEEVAQAKAILRETQQDLKREGHSFDEGMEVGIMVETPSVAVVAETFAEEVDFFSIGTNDLIQYTLAIDRGNDRVAHLYEPFHPAILRSLHQIVEAARDARIWVGVCGEMASDPLALLFLIGIGVDEISTAPFMVPHTKNVIRSVYFEDLRLLSRALLKLRTAEEARAHAIEFAQKRLADLKIYL
jgi:phosphoenolpyruvate-protein phosphotransferase (PTS system enzyme I)